MVNGIHDDPQGHSQNSLEKRNTLIAVSLGIACIPLTVSLSGVTLEPIRQQLSASYADLQWFLNAFLLLYASLPVAFGHVADRRGRRRIFILGVIGFIAAPIVCAVAPNIQTLIAGRLLLGIAAALIGASSLALISHAFTQSRERKIAFCIMGAFLGLALALGAAGGGMIIDLVGWRFALLGQGLFAILPLLFLKGTRESFDNSHQKIDYPGAALSTAALALWMAFGIVGPSSGWSGPLSLMLFASALVATVTFVAVELRSKSPMIEFAMFSNRNFSAATAAVMAVTAISVTGFYFIPLYYQSSGGMSAAQAGSLMLYMFAPAIFAPLVVGWLTRWIGSGVLLGAGFVVMAAGFGFLHQGFAASGALNSVLFGLILLGIGSGMIAGLVEATALSALPPEKAATGTGVFDSLRIVGNSMGAIVGGAVLVQVFSSAIASPLASAGLDPDRPEFATAANALFVGDYSNPAVAGIIERGVNLQNIASQVHSAAMATLMLVFVAVAIIMALVCLLAIRARHEIGATQGKSQNASQIATASL